MSEGPDSIVQLLSSLFWPADPAAQAAILLLAGFAAVIALTVQGPLIVQLVRIGRLQRAVQSCFYDETSNSMQRQQLAAAFTESPLAYHWDEFVRRWHNAIAADPIQDASLPELSRAPVRLMDVLKEHPILAAGARRSLLPALPAIFLSAGLLGAFAALVLALPGIGPSLAQPGVAHANGPHDIGMLLDQLGMALRIGLWGLLLSLLAAISGRLIEGRADVQNEALDGWVQLAYGSISTGELATRAAHEQRSSFLRLQDEIAELARDLGGRPRVEVGLASARAASNANAINELTQAVERLVKGSESQSTATRSLTQTAQGLSDAAETLRSGLDELGDLVDALRSIGVSTAAGVPTGAATSATGEDDDEDLAPLDDSVDSALPPPGPEPTVPLRVAPVLSRHAIAARPEPAPVSAAQGEPESLSGLLRPTHHSGPYSAPPPASAGECAGEAREREERQETKEESSSLSSSSGSSGSSAAASLLGGNRPPGTRAPQ